MTVAQINILVEMRKQGLSGVSEIADALGRHPSTIRGTMNILIRDKLVVRKGHGVYGLTSAGKRKVAAWEG